MEIIKIVILSLSGLMLLFVGAMRLSNPVKAYSKNSGIQLENDTSLLNEMRGVSAVMLSGGIIAFLGVLFPAFALTSYAVASLIFVGFAIGRCISIAMDGKPSPQIMQGIVFELVLGGANVFALVHTVM